MDFPLSLQESVFVGGIPTTEVAGSGTFLPSGGLDY